MPRPACLDPSFERAVRRFNAGEFFDAHEEWEACWTSNFEKGLIQAAVALYQLDRENRGGALKMYAGFRRYIEPYRPAFWGLDVERLVREMEACLAELTAKGADSDTVMDRSLVPRIAMR